MSANVQINALNQDTPFAAIPGNAPRWIGSRSSTPWLDLAGASQRTSKAGAPFISMHAPKNAHDGADNASGKDTEALEAAQGFEQIFVQYLMKSMRKAVPEGGLLGNSFASGIYQGMFDDYLSEQGGKGSGLGVADMLYEEIVRQKQGVTAYQAMAAEATDALPAATEPSHTHIEASGANPSSR